MPVRCASLGGMMIVRFHSAALLPAPASPFARVAVLDGAAVGHCQHHGVAAASTQADHPPPAGPACAPHPAAAACRLGPVPPPRLIPQTEAQRYMGRYRNSGSTSLCQRTIQHTCPSLPAGRFLIEQPQPHRVVNSGPAASTPQPACVGVRTPARQAGLQKAVRNSGGAHPAS